MGGEGAVREILAEGLEDWVPIDRVVGRAREMADQFRPTAIRLVEYLLRNELVRIGDIGEGGFEEWPGDVEENIERVVRGLEVKDWNAMGELCWLANTARGDDFVRETYADGFRQV